MVDLTGAKTSMHHQADRAPPLPPTCKMKGMWASGCEPTVHGDCRISSRASHSWKLICSVSPTSGRRGAIYNMHDDAVGDRPGNDHLPPVQLVGAGHFGSTKQSVAEQEMRGESFSPVSRPIPGSGSSLYSVAQVR